MFDTFPVLHLNFDVQSGVYDLRLKSEWIPEAIDLAMSNYNAGWRYLTQDLRAIGLRRPRFVNTNLSTPTENM